jgi:Asp-tRNA(Asn)/Glu-tRNA(Gln) amidotransferase C subunit
MLANPSWSVASLQETQSASQPSATVTQKELHHLLRLSALPLPKSPEEEAKMIHTLESQLHFVQAIQSVDTAGVEPLRSVRDETERGQKEHEYNLASMKAELDKEEVVGHSRRIRRKITPETRSGVVSDWDPLALAPKKFGRFIAVETGRR